MARKLSRMGRRAPFLSLAAAALAAQFAMAQGEIQVTAPGGVVENPFFAPQPSQPKPRIVAEEPQPVRRGVTTYQNPFANMSKAPPIDTSLRPGPVSRWQRPAIPGNEPSAIKSAVLSPAQTTASGSQAQSMGSIAAGRSVATTRGNANCADRPNVLRSPHQFRPDHSLHTDAANSTRLGHCGGEAERLRLRRPVRPHSKSRRTRRRFRPNLLKQLQSLRSLPNRTR